MDDGPLRVVIEQLEEVPKPLVVLSKARANVIKYAALPRAPLPTPTTTNAVFACCCGWLRLDLKYACVHTQMVLLLFLCVPKRDRNVLLRGVCWCVRQLLGAVGAVVFDTIGRSVTLSSTTSSLPMNFRCLLSSSWPLLPCRAVTKWGAAQKPEIYEFISRMTDADAEVKASTEQVGANVARLSQRTFAGGRSGMLGATTLQACNISHWWLVLLLLSFTLRPASFAVC